ncbi:MAG: hypothetical protein K0R85_147 [Devosia sp.]|nr:hypothetical protein [Devosia sp.]
MVLSFLGALRLAQSGMLQCSPFSPPCGGIGVTDWDYPLASIFARLRAASNDGQRLSILDEAKQVFARRAVMVETIDLAMRDELMTVVAKLGEWADALQADMQICKAA